MINRVLERLRKRQQGIGYTRLVLYAGVWLVRKLSLGLVEFDYRYLLMQPVPERSLLRGRTPGGFTMAVLAGDALLAADARDHDAAFSREPRDHARFLRRVQRGDVCFAAMRDERAEGVLWLTFETFDESDVKAVFRVHPAHGMAWDSNLYIMPDARGGFIFALLWDAANAWLRERGYRWVATQTSAFNGPSLQAHQRMGSRRIGWMLYVLIGRWQVTSSSLRPRLDLRAPRAPALVYTIPLPPPAADASA
ncbi:MAG: hypothetical protein RLW62_07460 [Gammaproteobacteria bacterium]